MTKASQSINEQRNAQASALAMASVEQLPRASTSLVEYRSHGKLAVIGGQAAQEFAPRLCGDLVAQVILTDAAVEPGVPTIPVGNRLVSITGHLGNFSIMLGEQGQPNCEKVEVDMVLDLGETPILTMPVKPPGYLTCVTEEPYLTQVEQELKALTGTFEKPRYFDYDAAICAHSRSGISGCTQCIDACPADAITSLLESVEVDPYLCQGGGVCASVCPTGAIRYVYPGTQDTLHAIRTLLQLYGEAGGDNPVIAFIAAAETDTLCDRPPNMLALVVEELASAGMDTWLSALAYGAKAVLLLDAGSMPGTVAAYLDRQIEAADCVLQGMGYASGAIRVVDPATLAQQGAGAEMVNIASTATYSGSVEKRRTVFQAIDHLYRQSESAQDIIALPQGSPFGRVIVDTAACTLCMGCTSVCPSRALGAGNDLPRLEFYEINCVQCGICASACPEQALTLEPRLITDQTERRRMVVLHEETPFCCISCGKAFATKTLIDTMTKKLEGHYMFSTERAKQRLLMCEDCRVVDVVQDEDAMNMA